MLGVETALAVAITKLVEPGVMTLAEVLARAVAGSRRASRGSTPPATGCRSRPATPRTSA